MNHRKPKNSLGSKRFPRAFTLIITISMMVLLTLIAIGFLSLSTVTLRASAQGKASAEARSNARMAMLMALGELQKEMGPDRRISTEAAIFDKNPDTPAIDGVNQPRWLASYHSWGNWLNTSHTLDNGSTIPSIRDTYRVKRSNMFRRWLLSMPPSMEYDVNAADAVNGWNNNNSVIMVGEGSIGASLSSENQNNVTRAYLHSVGTTGRNAWWISPENHKAKVNLAKKNRNLSADQWQASQGNTAEVGVGGIDGFASLDRDSTISDRLFSTNTLVSAQVDKSVYQRNFFDLTAQSKGVMTSVRSGHLKKDLSLLFEREGAQMPAPYRFTPRSDEREPSIRPMSSDLASYSPVIPRHFASWTNMRHFYRMYRSGTDATPTDAAGVSGILTWTGGKPATQMATSSTLGVANPSWEGSNHYWRTPILAKLTLIYSLVTRPSTGGKFTCSQYYIPVFTFWNPYNTEMVIPSRQFSIACKPYQLWPTNQKFYLNGVLNGQNGLYDANNFTAQLSSGNGGNIIFKPGELRVFSLRQTGTSMTAQTNNLNNAELLPGFDPTVLVGDERDWGTNGGAKTKGPYSSGDRPGASYEFSSAQWGGGVNLGNTGGAVVFNSKWPNSSGNFPMTYSNDWFQRSPHVPDQTFTPITPPGVANIATWDFDGNPKIVAYAQMAIKGLDRSDYPSIGWARDWRSRNWIHAPPYYFGSGMYISQDDTMAHTQRLDCPYVVTFGPTSNIGVSKVIGQIGEKAFLGNREQVSAISMLELPSAPISSLAGFAGMRINPGWMRTNLMGSHLSPNRFTGNGNSSAKASLFASEGKKIAYQSGVTGPGIGNSFMHPMLPRNDVYRFVDNSKSQDTIDRGAPSITETVDTKAYCDYWDHVFLLNDALWDDYFLSSLAEQQRPAANSAVNFTQNIDRFITKGEISNSRFSFYSGGRNTEQIKSELSSEEGFLRSARYLLVDGMFNVNSTSVAAWQALFAGIRERQLVFRNASGNLQPIAIPSGKRIALSRFDTEVSDKEMSDPLRGVAMPDGSSGWSGVRFLDDAQILRLAEECVKQVKLRGPFLNFSEFINRRLSNDQLGLMGALQNAIDYDNNSPDSRSLNFRYKSPANIYMISEQDLGANVFSTPQAATGSRLAGIPGYLIQSDVLKPIANTMNVRDDTFLIRAYGESLDSSGKVLARAWCEATVQRVPEYVDPTNEPHIGATNLSAAGQLTRNNTLTVMNQRFGRKFQIQSFRWLANSEI